jgi:carbonic anhydrase
MMKTELRNDLDSVEQHAVRANVDVSVNHLRHGSEILEQLTQTNDLLIVGAEYSLKTGKVEFFHDE